MITAGDFRNGVTFDMDGNVYQIIEFQHVKPGKGAAFVRTKIKNVISGAVTEKTFNPTDKFPTAFIERREMQYLYNDGDLYYFMDNETYENMPINYYFKDGDFTIVTVDKNGNGESKYLTQADFDEINDYLEEKVDRDQWSAAGENDTIKASLKNDQTISGYEVIEKRSYTSKEYVQSKDGVMKLIDEICYYDGALTQAIGKANDHKVEVYMNITNDAVTVWFVAQK